ncbi:hypothetical protein SmJEL517_g04893 [Synchytrium microbalum]|uniref:C3H1-type domain-containing protein n=1 Tax=Synchytrium microbalum TaxID=1806994 RepID=A0A507BPA6_9FUNG|nr:uncharacterized protein SmJEL517_g04893 [Synchytrium microbalum]TPX31830.1 hypothetical protein SmJEL517_g04893 [Synchytrium microbalum]
MASEKGRPRVMVPKYTEVTVHNIASMQFGIQMAINRAVYISVDFEFSGLGDRKQQTRSDDLAVRYKALANVAQRYALLTMGLTTFELAPSKGNDLEHRYTVNNFAFLLKCQKDYQVSSASLSFLADTGLDLSRVMRDGIPYMPGTHKNTMAPADAVTNPEWCLRSILTHTLSRKVPFIIHNGLLDLCFLYEAFYTELPDTLDSFIVDLYELFAGGLYDTKYIADYVDREGASFLSYLYRKYEREQVARKLKGTEHFLTFEANPPLHVKIQPPPLLSGKRGADRLFCEHYASFGYCKNGRQCFYSHDLDVILDCEEKGLARKSKKRKRNNHKTDSNGTVATTEDTTDIVKTDAITDANKQTPIHNEPDVLMQPALPVLSSSIPPASTSSPLTAPPIVVNLPATTAVFEVYHSAAFDAYMTGCVFAHQQLHHTVIETRPNGIKDFVNKINLMGKDKPLLIQPSAFAKISDGHRDMKKRLFEESGGGTGGSSGESET